MQVDKLSGKKVASSGRRVISDLEVAEKKLHKLEAENLANKEELKKTKAELFESEQNWMMRGEKSSSSCVVS